MAEAFVDKNYFNLQNMIDLSDEDSGFLDMWGNDPDVIEAVKKRIEVLNIRLLDLI